MTDVLKLGAAPTIAEINPDDFDLVNDPHGMNKTKFDTAVKINYQKQCSLKDSEIPFFYLMLGHCSRESRQLLREQPTWDQIYNVKDPVALLLLIRATHSGVKTGVDLLDAENARKRYANVRQQENEDLRPSRQGSNTWFKALLNTTLQQTLTLCKHFISLLASMTPATPN
jgi:hypothetical protein